MQATENYQNYNRYSYVLNNPLSYTDPSGHFFKELFGLLINFVKKFWTTIVSIALYAIPGIGVYLAIAFNVALGAARGGMKGALLAAFGIAMTAGIGDAFGEAFRGWGLELARAFAHGVTQGGLAELSGGDFGSGFLGGFAGSVAGSAMASPKGVKHFGKPGGKNQGLMVKRTVAAAVVGGTVAEIGGGKFANGAASAAMVHLFNHEWPKKKEDIVMQILPTDEAKKLIEEGFPVELTGTVHNDPERGVTLQAVDENNADDVRAVPPGYTALGADGFFDPVVYADTKGTYTYFKLTRGVEMLYIGTEFRLDPIYGAIYQMRKSGIGMYKHHNPIAVVDSYTPFITMYDDKISGGWKTFWTWPATEEALRKKGLLE